MLGGDKQKKWIELTRKNIRQTHGIIQESGISKKEPGIKN